MRNHPGVLLLLSLVTWPAVAASKPHVIVFGKATVGRWLVGPGEDKPVELRIRPLYVDTRLKEYTLGAAHEVTERLFVVRRVFRVNDNLPEESSAPQWRWQRGGWLLVDRVTGRISQVPLPDYDPYYSIASWYRDYAAYCGISEDGKKLFAVVAQIGRRKPILKKALGDAGEDDMPDSDCPAPVWQRKPVRVSFEPEEGQKLTYSVRGRVVDVVNDADEEGEE
ncbi:MAG TPA: hypothetical protein VJQ82_24040 [Terriglobales bacterium]|nr:hypothetical protein [Terriglobales bacterium]